MVRRTPGSMPDCFMTTAMMSALEEGSPVGLPQGAEDHPPELALLEESDVPDGPLSRQRVEVHGRVQTRAWWSGLRWGDWRRRGE